MNRREMSQLSTTQGRPARATRLTCLLFCGLTFASCATGRLRSELEQTRQQLHRTQEELRGLKQQRQDQQEQNKALRLQLKRIKMIQQVAQRVSRLPAEAGTHPLELAGSHRVSLANPMARPRLPRAPASGSL